MLFNSYVFIFAFLPIVLIGWHGLNHLKQYKMAQVFVILMSLWFYGYFNYSYIAIILASMSVNWLISKGIDCFPNRRKIIGILGVAFNLGLLFYFKYYDFFIENMNVLFKTDWQLKNIVLPLGISFFTFQQISFVADRMKGTAPHYDVIDYMAYVAYFPQLIAGPIVSHDDLIPQFWDTEKRHFNWYSMLYGTRLFVIGLAKKVLLADELGKLVDAGYMNVAGMDSIGAFVVMLAYTFQIFFDFSGYCDMALGLGKMMNLELPLNFNLPYKSHSIKEFWNRWHITLNTFFTKYVYIPLGGSRRGKARQLCNTMIVFLLSGIWHGANWTFVLWGILHGVVVCFDNLVKPAVDYCQEHAAKGYKWLQRVRWALTFAFVNLAWVLFRSDSIGVAIQFYKRLFSFSHTGYIWELAGSMSSYKNYPIQLFLDRIGGYNLASKLFIVWMILFLLLASFLCTRRTAKDWVESKKAGVIEMAVLAVLFGLSVLAFSGVATFLYFNF